MKKVLLAGATGYLGSFIVKELKRRGYYTKAIVRNLKKLGQNIKNLDEAMYAEVTRPETLKGCCEDIDIVISSIGITRQKDGLSFLDVDYQANMNLLEQARRSGVKKFIYVSALNGDKLKHLKVCEAKEMFVESLKESGLAYCIVRPNGFFSDMTEFYNMAKNGRVLLYRDGRLKLNPIHGEDLAKVVVECIKKTDTEIEAGGPELLTQNEIAYAAFEALNKNPKITYIPEWLRKVMLLLIRTFTGSKTYGPIEFFLSVMAIEMAAPCHGTHTLKDYYIELSQRERDSSVPG